MRPPPPPGTPLTIAQQDKLLRAAAGEPVKPGQPTDHLEAAGYIRHKAGAGPTVYELTEAGRALLDTMATPVSALQQAVQQMAARWQKQFDDAAPRLADYFATDMAKRSDAVLRSILKEGGFSVRFQMTPAAQEIIDATVHQGVSLIRSIPQQYLTNVEGLVMRSVQAGRDLGPLAKALEEQYGVTKRRAALIARDQNNKATAAMTRARQVELGLYKAVWQHSGASREPRPKHVKASGTTYDVRKGLKIGDKGDWVLPGEEINCKCISRTLVPGLS